MCFLNFVKYYIVLNENFEIKEEDNELYSSINMI